MIPTELDARFHGLAAHLHKDHMACPGIENTMRLAESYNECKFAQEKAWWDRLYRSDFAKMLEENGGVTRPPVEMHDGWAVDTSLSLPHLDRVLEDSDRIFAERAGQRRGSSWGCRRRTLSILS